MINKRAVFVNTASQILVRFVTLAFTLISIKLLTNYLGIRGVGEFNTVTTYINFFIVIADLGLFSVTVREISKNPANEKKIITNVLSIRLISALAACLIAVILVSLTKYRLEPNILYGVMIATGFLLFNLLGSVYDMILQFRLKMQYSALAEFLSKLLSILALYLIIILRGNFLWIIATVALSGILIYLFKWLFARIFIRFGAQFDREIARWIFNLSWPIGIVFILNNLYFKLDTLMLFIIKGASAVGIYTVAYKVLEVTAFFGSYFASALKPALSQNIETKKIEVGNIIQKSLSVMLFIALPISIICVVFAKEIIVFLSNQDFISGSRALVFLAFTLPIIYFDVLLSEILIASDQRKLLVKIAISVLLFNFIFNLIFIPRYSFMGAAWGTFISEILLFLINYYYTQRIVRYHFEWKNTAKIVAISMLTAIFAYIFKSLEINFLILIAMSLALYLFFSFNFKVLSIQMIRDIFSPNQN